MAGPRQNNSGSRLSLVFFRASVLSKVHACDSSRRACNCTAGRSTDTAAVDGKDIYFSHAPNSGSKLWPQDVRIGLHIAQSSSQSSV
jgi:hypothetical protein